MEIQKANTNGQLTQLPTLPINVDSLKLTVTEKEIAVACQGERLKDIDIGRITLFMIGLIGKTYLNTGGDFDRNKEMIDSTVDELCSDLKKYNGTLTLAEIELAFKNGWKKEYGDFYGLNNATYFGWVNAYCFGEKRLRVKKTLSEAKENANKEPEKKTPEEIDYILKEACLKSFDDYRNGVVVFDAGNVKYNYLAKVGLIDLTKERKAEFMLQAEQKIRELALETKGKSETIEKCFAKIQPLSVQSEAKRLALIDYFKNLAEMETELSELF